MIWGLERAVRPLVPPAPGRFFVSDILLLRNYELLPLRFVKLYTPVTGLVGSVYNSKVKD
jgi:hypothetical protein